jgi:hypothetical protein
MFQFCFVKLGSVAIDAIVQHHNSITSPHVVLYHTAILTSIHVSKAPESRTAAVAFQQLRACRPAWGSQAPGCCTINRLTVTILHEPAMSLATSPATPQFHDVLRNVFQKPTCQRLQSVKSVILDDSWGPKVFFQKWCHKGHLYWDDYDHDTLMELAESLWCLMCAGSFDGNTIPGTNG